MRGAPHLLELHSERKRVKKRERDRRKESVCVCVCAAVIVFLRTCLSLSVDVCGVDRRQLRVPSEGPPGAFAPVVERHVGGGEQLSSVRFISLKRSGALLQGWCLHSNHLGPNRFNTITHKPHSQVQHTFLSFC